MNTMILVTYSIYVFAGVSVTWWVARKLDQHGVVFARSGDKYDDETGPAMSHLLVVGFALVALGVVSLALGIGSSVSSVQQCIESLSSKLGWVIMAIGALHFSMLAVFAAMGRKYGTPSSGRSTGHEASNHAAAELLNRLHPHG